MYLPIVGAAMECCATPEIALTVAMVLSCLVFLCCCTPAAPPPLPPVVEVIITPFIGASSAADYVTDAFFEQSGAAIAYLAGQSSDSADRYQMVVDTARDAYAVPKAVAGTSGLVLSYSLAGTSGGAAITSGLAGLGYTIGLGMTGGIFSVAFLPTVAAYTCTAGLVERTESHPQVKKETKAVGILGGFVGTLGSLWAVSAAAGEGLSGAAAMTSGLANLGGGSVAAGGAGMMGGMITVATIPVVNCFACAAAFWFVREFFPGLFE